MLKNIPLGPQPVWKRPVYITLSVLLGLIFSYGAHAIIEIWYLRWVETNHITIVWTSILGTCAFPLWVQILLPVVGAVTGFFQGRAWWRWVYVERRWERQSLPAKKGQD